MNWKNFKTEPPHNYESKGPYEDDPQVCWFIYQNTSRPSSMNKGPFLSHAPCTFIDGVFEGYESHMKTSPYPEDRIEILYWCDADEIKDKIMEDYNNFARDYVI